VVENGINLHAVSIVTDSKNVTQKQKQDSLLQVIIA
jgi:hypothetical protein